MIDRERFLEWVISYFGEDNISFAKNGEEICVNSPFEHDEKQHLWMNPSGGKSKHPENGSYRCWYSDRKGSLISLVSELEHIDWDEAEDLISTESSLRTLEAKLHNFFKTENETVVVEVPTNIGKIQLPDSAYLIDSLNEGDTYYNRATNYLKSRKIPTDGLYVTIGGKYDNRILIPYYDKNGNLIWFNARTMSKDKKCIRYMKPDTDIGISQEEVLYIPKWPKTKNNKVFVMEGEFDAKSLDLCGFYAAACGGKSLTDSQIDLIRDQIFVLAFDADRHGKKALIQIGNDLLSKGFTQVYYVRPPEAYKDWNKFLQKKNPEIIKEYIQKFTKKYTLWSEGGLNF